MTDTTTPAGETVREADRDGAETVERVARIISPWAWDQMPPPLTRFRGAGPWPEGQFYVWDHERAAIHPPDGKWGSTPWRKLTTMREASEAAEALNQEHRRPYLSEQAKAIEKARAIIAALRDHNA